MIVLPFEKKNCRKIRTIVDIGNCLEGQNFANFDDFYVSGRKTYFFTIVVIGFENKG